MRNKIISAVMATLLAAPVTAGVVFEIETTSYGAHQSSPESGTMRAIVEGRNLKMLIKSDDQGSENDMIFRGDRREMAMVNHEDRSYILIDEDGLRSIGEQLSGVEAQMQEALKNVPPERRAMMEAMMKRQMPTQIQNPSKPMIEIVNTGERDTKNGYPSEKYELLINGRMTQEMWVTSWDNIDGGDEANAAFRDMSEFFREMRDAMPQFIQGAASDDNFFQHLAKMDGYPVLTLDYSADGTLQGETALRSSKRQSFDSADFEPPEGYKRQEMFGR